MNNLSGFNSQEIRRLHPYLSALLRRVKALEAGAGKGGAKIEWGTDSDIQPTANANIGGILNRVARADHQHLFKFPVAVPLSTPDGSAFFDLSSSAINIYVGNTPTTKVVAGATTSDVQPTGTKATGTAPRYSFADHSHPTALLPESDPQTPVVDEIRYDTNDKVVRWDGTAWVPLSVETFSGSFGTNADVQPTKLRDAGASTLFARADHSHPTAILPESDTQTPEIDEIRYNTNDKIVRWDGSAWVEMSVETVEAGLTTDVQPTKLKSAGTSTRFAKADHSHPTAILPQSDAQTPVVDEIRYDTNDKVVRWDGTNWVALSVETFTVDWATNADVQPTKLRSTGSSIRFARSDHSHPTALLPESDPQTPETDEIRYNTNDKLVRWDGTNWVELSVETVEAGVLSDVQPTKLKSAGTSSRFSRADHSHPTALLPQSDSQTPVADEIRYTGTNRLVRWNGSAWVDFVGALPVPADPLVLPFDTQVSSPQDRQLVNRSGWDNIGHATIFYRDANNSQYRLAFTRPLVIATSSTPSGKDFWANKANELVLKYQSGDPNGATGVLWSRGGNTTVWSPIATQLLDDTTTVLPTDVGVLTRSPLTGTSGSRRWFLRGAQEDGSFRAPFAGFASFASADTPSHSSLSTNLGDGYAYFIHDIDRVDVVRPTTDGNKYCTMLSHSIIAPPCRVFSTATDPSGQYVKDEIWNEIWVLAFYTTTSSTTNFWATLPTMAIPYGITGGRALLYLHNPQSSQITTVFRVAINRPTSTGVVSSSTANTNITIPANTTVVADCGHFNFIPSTTLSHHRSHLITPFIVRQRSAESANANKVLCLGMVIIPQRAS